MKKKILIFSTAYLPFVGGAEVAVKEITDRLPEIQFDMITARFKRRLPKFEKIGKINIYRLGLGAPILDKLFLPFLGAILALRLNQKNHYDFFWCLMAAYASGAAYLANLIIFWKPVPIILTLQEGDSEEHFEKRWFGLINLSWRLALKRTKILTAISSYLAKRAEKFGYAGEIQIIPNGVDLKDYQEKNINYELRNKLGILENEKIVITVSRLVKKNGVGDLIEAMPYLGANVKLIIAGGGELMENLKSKILKLKIGGRVIMLGAVENKDVPAYLALADIFVRPSLSEGLGNAFLEAMAAGVPVIGTPVGGIVDFLVDGETGLVCALNSPASIAEKIKIYLENKDLTEKIKINARKLVINKYDWNLIAEKMRRIFEKIIV